MSIAVSVRPVSHPLKAPFRISRGVKTTADVVEVIATADGHVGRGESVPYGRYGETVDSVLAQLVPLLASGDVDAAYGALPPGAARNALDLALWDLRAKRTGVSVADAAGLPVPPALVTAVTVSLDTPEAMGLAARAVADAPLIKVKLSADDPAARLRAVAAAAPNSRFIVDPNEGWTFAILKDLKPLLADLPIALVEQPLPADADHGLDGWDPPFTVCADESVHVGGDLAALRGRYQAVNLKLDKTGGLTEAVSMLRAARSLGFQLMTGCMVASSLGVAPALHLAGACDYADLDGPWWLAVDHPGGLRVERGRITPPKPGFWGDGVETQGLWLG
ncbi:MULTISPECIES: dipeptide epimerase [unclassified Caulobacter]|uniref:dipeptide epimerase n=1 Tax=unclassified Caulobacter TaxID=2648921 RepID=UPI0006F1E66A|nr:MULTISPECIES: dipeptide epimerase [unclassified Caulobacter]KQV54822.1 mandelate racemase [Caulobacter sp. Root342]KQV68571.1 mandelate racemase [Caulobacter sp. Root343]